MEKAHKMQEKKKSISGKKTDKTGKPENRKTGRPENRLSGSCGEEVSMPEMKRKRKICRA